MCALRSALQSRLFVNFFCTQRNPKYWPNPDAFIPERHETTENLQPGSYTPFSAGPRNCASRRSSAPPHRWGSSRFADTAPDSPPTPPHPPARPVRSAGSFPHCTGIGQSFAYLESKMVLAHFMRTFDWEVVDKEVLNPVDFLATITLRPVPYQIRLKVRTLV